jgi:nucleotide-binding universal stress UspA family protein
VAGPRVSDPEGVTRTRIVVGVDGSATSQEALRWAVALGDALDADVVAVHALGLLDRWRDADASARSWQKPLCDLVERTWCAPLVRAPGAHRVELHDCHPADVLLAVAARGHAALLVVGSRGAGANPALALASTSLRILQTARLPVPVVPERRNGAGAAEGIRPRHLLVGVDGSEPSLAALDLAADMTELLGGSLSVLQVFEYVPPFPLETGAKVDKHTRERALELLEASACAIRRRGVGVQTIIRSGDAAGTLLDVADDVDADLIVVGTRGRGGPHELLLGSVARTVADRARRPTLVVPAAAGRVHLGSTANHGQRHVPSAAAPSPATTCRRIHGNETGATRPPSSGARAPSSRPG